MRRTTTDHLNDQTHLCMSCLVLRAVKAPILLPRILGRARDVVAMMSVCSCRQGKFKEAGKPGGSGPYPRKDTLEVVEQTTVSTASPSKV